MKARKGRVLLTHEALSFRSPSGIWFPKPRVRFRFSTLAYSILDVSLFRYSDIQIFRALACNSLTVNAIMISVSVPVYLRGPPGSGHENHRRSLVRTKVNRRFCFALNSTIDKGTPGGIGDSRFSTMP
eukprot:4095602-Pyramimonas_sp.AAC.1